jgi:uroporphyrinogen decarboxylase
MAPAIFRELFKPYFKKYIEGIKKHCPNAKLAHHCCGSSYLLLDDFAEIGVDVINPVQTTAKNMSPENLAKKKNRLSFHGGGDLQYILPHGTALEVEDFIKNLVLKLGPGGGYILAPCHSVPEDVKPENLITMFETALKFGKYPILSPPF